MKLNLGCCGHKLESFIDIDFCYGIHPDVVADVKSLPFADGSASEILASHILEHFPWTENPVAEWFRVLRPLGKITICVPDVFRSAMLAEDGHINREWLADLCFGMGDHQTGRDGTVHYRAYTPRILREELEKAGFRGIRHLDPRFCKLLNSGIIEQLVMEAIKPEA